MTPAPHPTASPPPAPGPAAAWHTMTAVDVLDRLLVDPAEGLSHEEVEDRAARFGPNQLAEPPREPRWKLFLDQFRSGIVLVLVGAAVLAGAFGDVKDPIVIGVVLLVNAVLGYVQEAKASDALDALKQMLVSRVRVRRDDHVVEVTTDELVPGDVVLLEAGDRVPADGRLVVASSLAVDESPLTGESVPVEKDVLPVVDPEAPLGDRTGSVFMNTTVVRGRAELVVTETGMRTEMGRVAELLSGEDPGPTPLQRQLDGLSKRLALIGVAAVAVVFTLQMLQGTTFADAALGAVALAVAAIPEGLPAVVTVTLAIGVSRMARRNAIVKRLHSVETLGSTTVICSDKTGTLTLNQMTARELARGGVRWQLTGEGYATGGGIVDAHGVEAAPGAFGDAMLAVALCSDAVVDEGAEGPRVVGDPTEGALVVAAAKAGVDAPAARREHPRLGEVPFDSATKFMATFHSAPGRDDEVLVCVKGAPDVLLARCGSFVDAEGTVRPLDDAARADRRADNDRMAAGGLRVLAVATRRVPADDVLAGGEVADPGRWVEGLTLDALVGIVDPPRPEAREAIALCGAAGIGVKMITGDHATTAGAIADELGIVGEVVSGEQLSEMSDEQLAARIDRIGVCARVSPEHKVRVVEALRSRGHVVAMTGDGVNDAAALRRADIGVAMGITGTEVTKEAGDMVLTDDDFATIVGAVERGRTIYDNIVKFVRFQLSTNLAAIATFLGAGLAGLPVPFTPIQVLWVNLIADGPPAISLGVDAPAPGIMGRRPRPPGASILPAARLARLILLAVVMAVGTLAVFAWSRDRYGETVALTMTFTTFVLYQMVNVFNARSEDTSALSRYSLTNRGLWAAVAGVVALQVVATTWEPLERLFDTTDLTLGQWGIALAVASTVLWVEELRKLGARALRSRRPSTEEVPAP